MHSIDKNFCIDRYTDRFKEHGYSPQSLGWGDQGKQAIRFKIMCDIGIDKNSSILDVGCGFGDLRRFLTENGWEGEYLGLDFVPDFIEEARKRQPNIKVASLDILKDDLAQKFDFVFSSGIFNAKLKATDNYTYIQKMLGKMLQLSNKGVAADFLSSYVDYETELTFHSDPSRILEICKSLSKRVSLRHDYMPYEFTAYIHKDDSISEDVHVFSQHVHPS